MVDKVFNMSKTKTTKISHKIKPDQDLLGKGILELEGARFIRKKL